MIEIRHLNKTFGEREIFRDFSLTINDGDFVIISGASGKGKTTLLNIIGMLESFDSGELLVDGVALENEKARREYWTAKVGFLFQNFALIENKTVLYNLKIVKENARSESDVDEVLEKVGLLDKKDAKVHTLSGGEQQRIALARLFLKKCDVVLADEPTGSLDKVNAELVMRLLDELNANGKTVVIVTHDESFKTMGKRSVVEL
ncbi:MAG: ATP-binding cassette domain-containing protein [Oscillospiraceae bacterium]|jgi:putative ABC transport system ATP-binding protein|nr:ATP-binding cassette domain-containing protein [Oscillospiraceae bacterium]